MPSWPASLHCQPANMLPCPPYLKLCLADGEQSLNHELHSLVDLSLVKNAAEALKDACKGRRQGSGEQGRGRGRGDRLQEMSLLAGEKVG